jgi:ankyrin repeat and zinc finger domain-containing protein 1
MSFYVFSLPPDLLGSLVPRTLVEPAPRAPSPPTSRPSALTTGSISCNICLGASFADVDDQRDHFRSDWHRYNVKLRLRGADVVAEAQFASLLEGERTGHVYDLHSTMSGLEDSLSGSASDDDDESDDSSPDAVRALLSRTRNPTRAESPTSTIPNPPRTALTWFHSPPSTQIGIYNALFPLKLPQASYLSVLKDMQRGGPNGRRWTMLMVAGGHFAGLVAQVRKPDGANAEEELSGGKKKKSKPKPEVEVIRHKTFHRYTSQPVCFIYNLYSYISVQRGESKEAPSP